MALLFVGAVAAAILTPSTDAIEMMLLWVPITVVLFALFELSFLLYRRQQKIDPQREPADPRSSADNAG
jgi:Sec-independent protein secretion pathway component TatC